MEHCIQEERLRKLETGQAETVVYYKTIKEDISEIKITMKEMQLTKNSAVNDINKTWQPIVLKSLEIVGTAIALFVALKAAGQ